MSIGTVKQLPTIQSTDIIGTVKQLPTIQLPTVQYHPYHLVDYSP